MRKTRRRQQAQKMVADMSNLELRDALSRRSIMFSWVAFIDENEKKAISRYIDEAADGLLEVEKEMYLREMTGKWN